MAREGNPDYSNIMRLYSATNYCLTISPDGTVCGETSDTDEYQILEVTTAGENKVRIRGVLANLFLCMDDNGCLKGEANPEAKGTVFECDCTADDYNIYFRNDVEEYPNQNCCIAINKHGTPKPGWKSRPGQKSSKFIPIRCDKPQTSQE